MYIVPSLKSNSPRRFFARIAVVTAITAVLTAPIGAGAAPTPDAAPTPQQLEVVAEHYNLARVKVDRATAALDATDRRIDAAQARVQLVRGRTRARAAALYQGTSAQIPVLFDGSSHAADLRRRGEYLDAAEQPDRDLLTTLGTELHRLASERASQQDARELLRRDVEDAARLKRQLQSLAALATARAAVPDTGDAAGPPAASPGNHGAPTPGPSTTTTRPTVVPPTGGPPNPPNPSPTTHPPSVPPPPSSPPGPDAPPVTAGAATAVAFARAQLGKPYSFNTAGPTTFDCSGLTMAAWAAAGVRMPHYSGSQAAMFPKVTWDQLQPGDIVVFYSDLHHVGLYIGGGMMIHAPQTGDVVKISPAWRTTFMWGVRPS